MSYFGAKRRGFTLLELSVVLIVISALTMIIYGPIMQRAEARNVRNTINQAQMIADEFVSIALRSSDYDSSTLTYIDPIYVDPITDEVKYEHLFVAAIYSSASPSSSIGLYPVNNQSRILELDAIRSPFNTDYLITSSYTGVRVEVDIPLQPAEIDLPDSQKQLDPTGQFTTITLFGRTRENVNYGQVKKAKFDKAYWFYESVFNG